jgi:hypothetical protein
MCDQAVMSSPEAFPAEMRLMVCFVCPGHIPDRNLVDIGLLMPELHRFSDYDNDNESRRLSK